MTVRAIVVVLLLLCSGPAAPLVAQTQPAPSSDSGHLFVRSDLWFAGGFVAGTIAMFPADRYFDDQLQDSTRQANRFFQNTAIAVRTVARPGAFIIGGALYAAGRLSHDRNMAELGLYGSEALLVTEVATRAIKGVAGRARPYVTGGDRPGSFELFRGIGDNDYQSFPSGHSATAFAAAAVLTAEARDWWPHAHYYVGTVVYGGAALVALSRMYNNKHWASDVMAGAAIGTFAGWKVVRWNHSNPDNRLNRWLLGVHMTPGEGLRSAVVWIAPAM
jgi:membrane-associated phospholipid phosphatase